MAYIQPRKNKDGLIISYAIRVHKGIDATSGKQLKPYSMTWKVPEGWSEKRVAAELKRQEVNFEEKCRCGTVLESNIKFADFSEKWLTDYADKQLKPKTVFEYKYLLKRINQAIGHIRLDKLQPHHLLEFYSNLEEESVREDTKYTPVKNFKEILKGADISKAALAEKAGVCIQVLDSCTSGKNINNKSAQLISQALNKKLEQLFSPSEIKRLSSKTILHHHRLISSILTTAVQWQILFSNPCERIKPPKVERKEARYLDDKQATKLLELLQAEPNQYRVMITLLLYTGFRRGELCGLEWKDIDFVNNLIHVRRASLYLPEKGIYEGTTKNYSSERVIKVSPSAFEMLRDHKAWQIEERLKLGSLWIKSDRLFTGWNGAPIHPDTLTVWFHKFIEKSGLPSVSIHSLRHTNATIMIAKGTPLRTVSGRLGHADLSTTGNIYTHAIKSADEAAAETIGDILDMNKKKA